MTFPRINHVDDLRPFVEGKKEISFIPGALGSTVVCYQFQDSDTFDTPMAREARGIVFDRDGNIAARPLHKFFNLGERPGQPDPTSAVRVMDKLDGSMIHTVWLDGQLFLKSKKSFNNKQVDMAWEWLRRPQNVHVMTWCEALASDGFTVIFELTSPGNRIVVSYGQTEMRVLHVRENETGAYFTRDDLFAELVASDIPLLVNESGRLTTAQALEKLPAMEGAEGFVLQFEDGDMVKVKCPWYLQLHRTISFTRERDIAEAALEERLDDIKAALATMNIDLKAVEAIEREVKEVLIQTRDQVEGIAQQAAREGVNRKEFALQNKAHAAFGLLMAAYIGQEVNYRDWFRKNVLKQAYSLDSLPGMPLTAD